MGKYGGTILTGRENFTLCQGNLEVELAATKLKRFLKPEYCIPPQFKNESELKEDYLIRLQEWQYRHAQALKIILQSIDNTNRIAIQSCRTAAAAYETLNSRYVFMKSSRQPKALKQSSMNVQKRLRLQMLYK
ncbi:Bgt-20938 [Blumeria graminis f. sp. tritici]|uniref:Bgt-20938 n=1 Tax=Blumeria graminis f. sp. tritici TaxID=62690 RepID=A0A9X9MPH7_BLUGR|nr:Bgt-20938 [Blumeria graminis f. sp. tritici]